MRTRLFLLAICSLLLSLLTPTTAANSLTANLEVIAVTDSKPGEVELTFVSKISNKRSYQITAKPKSGVGLTFSKTYKKRAPGYITHKISPLTSEVDYIFTITATTTKNKLIKSAPYNYLVSSTVPSTPLITKVEATDADEAVVFFTAPKDDGGTPIYYYTATSNPGAISVIAPIQGSGSVTITGLTKATTYTFTLTAHNINGSSRAATSPAPITTLAEKIVRSSPASTTNAPTLAAPAFTLSSSSQSVIVNTAITTVTNTSTGGAISSYAISPAAPAGLTFNTSTGQLSGTPNTVAAAANYTITATNATGSATQIFRLTVTAVVYTVGQAGPGGGIIFYVASTPFACGPTLASSCTYLEAAPALWNANAAEPVRTWAQPSGPDYRNTTVNNATSPETATATAIGWGYRNTRAIILQGNTDTATSAAALADSHTVTVSGVVYDDWYLPSQDELDLLYLERTRVGGFVLNGYWSSTENSTNVAWGKRFQDGGQYSDSKGNVYYVRPVRAF